jgi:CBS domain-containing protein
MSHHGHGGRPPGAMKQIPPIKSVMTPFPYAIDIGEPIERARALMAEHAITHLPVLEAGRPIGLLTSHALHRAAEEASVGEAEIAEIYVVDLTEPLDVVLLRMARRNLDAALVVKDERLVGIFTRTDACRSFGELLRTLFPRDHDDDAA